MKNVLKILLLVAFMISMNTYAQNEIAMANDMSERNFYSANDENTDPTGWTKDYPNETRADQERRIKKLIKKNLPKTEVDRISNIRITRDNKNWVIVDFDYFVYKNKKKVLYDGYFSKRLGAEQTIYTFTKKK